MPPMDPSMCSQIFLSLQNLLMLSIGSIAPRTVVPRVATIAKILLPSIEHLSTVFLSSIISIHPSLSVLTLIKLFFSRPIILVHFSNDE